METIYTVDDVLKMQKPASKFLVSKEANAYGIRFVGFKLRDCDTNEVFHEYHTQNIYELDIFAEYELQYAFPQRMLKSRTLGSSLKFVVGNQLVKNLDLIERHYIDDKLAASYKFSFPLFMPNSENNIEFIYSVPTLTEEVQQKLKKGQAIGARSDTFIFVDNKLIIHRRAVYSYVADK